MTFAALVAAGAMSATPVQASHTPSHLRLSLDTGTLFRSMNCGSASPYMAHWDTPNGQSYESFAEYVFGEEVDENGDPVDEVDTISARTMTQPANDLKARARIGRRFKVVGDTARHCEITLTGGGASWIETGTDDLAIGEIRGIIRDQTAKETVAKTRLAHSRVRNGATAEKQWNIGWSHEVVLIPGHTYTVSLEVRSRCVRSMAAVDGNSRNNCHADVNADVFWVSVSPFF
ncbi:hypothetical protein [Halalkalicoccus ordinarius]|uniref:hypothetical protein n=1 Tax=Halalkalicoccus ordinarius TaxID=3116651 RepID=UPI00300E8303